MAELRDEPAADSPPVANTRSERGRRLMPSAASVPRMVDSTTTAAATHRLSQVGRSQSSLPK